MKVAFLIQDLFARGAEYATALLVRGFVAKGYDVDLILSRVHKDKLNEGLKPFEIPPQTNVVHLKSRRARYNVLELRRYMKSTDAEVLIVVSPAYDYPVVLASFGLKRRIRLYTVRHVIDFALNEQLEYRKRRDSILARISDWFRYRWFSGILCVSNKMRTEMIRLRHLPESKVYTVFNPAIDESFLSKKRLAPTHPWLIDRSCPTFVTAGAFRPEKNHLMLMEAFRLVNRTRHARLIIFGRGDSQPEYEKFIRENNLSDVISLPGFSSVLPAEVAASSGYIASSLIESFGIAIVEALACGVPVISTDAPCGPREILKDGEYGELVRINSAEDMAQAVLRVIDGKVKVAPEESWRRFELPKIVELYERACGIYKEPHE